MRMLKKAMTAAAAAALALAMLTGCGGGGGSTPDNPSSSSSGSAAGGPSSSASSMPASSSSSSSSSSTETLSGSRTAQYFSKFNKEKIYIDVDFGAEYTNKVNVVAAINGLKYYYTNKSAETAGSSICDGDNEYKLIFDKKVAVSGGEPDPSSDTLASVLIGKLVPESYMYADLVPGTTTVEGKNYYSEKYTRLYGRNEAGDVILSYTFCFEGSILKYEVMSTDNAGSVQSVIYKINEISSDFDQSIFDLPSDYTVMTLQEYMLAVHNGTI